MPIDCAIEMLCDYLGAARAYWGKKFTYKDEYEWWLSKSKVAKIHPKTKKFITIILERTARYEDNRHNPLEVLNYSYLFYTYQLIL